jgi:hypothetical protein
MPGPNQVALGKGLGATAAVLASSPRADPRESLDRQAEGAFLGGGLQSETLFPRSPGCDNGVTRGASRTRPIRKQVNGSSHARFSRASATASSW